ncbi:hypothetical protein BGZ94_004741 [Podila epigama]|nr:hypothetical protein BGZ94_004741 [Podila epigama]
MDSTVESHSLKNCDDARFDRVQLLHKMPKDTSMAHMRNEQDGDDDDGDRGKDQDDNDDDINPLDLVHSFRHLEFITNDSPLLTLRFVFPSNELFPEVVGGAAGGGTGGVAAGNAGIGALVTEARRKVIVKELAQVRRRHLVDTYMLPHELSPVRCYDDTVLGFTGATKRVYSAIQEFLEHQHPQEDRFFIWRLCIYWRKLPGNVGREQGCEHEHGYGNSAEYGIDSDSVYLNRVTLY